MWIRNRYHLFYSLYEYTINTLTHSEKVCILFCLSKVKKRFKLTSTSTLEVYENAERQQEGLGLWHSSGDSLQGATTSLSILQTCPILETVFFLLFHQTERKNHLLCLRIFFLSQLEYIWHMTLCKVQAYDVSLIRLCIVIGLLLHYSNK